MTEEEISKLMQMYAEDAVTIAKKTYDITLDYSEQSLVAVDEILDKMTGGEIIPCSNLSEEDEELLWLHCKAYGGYVGEVIVRHIGAVWKIQQVEESSSRIELYVAGRITASPPDKIRKRLTDSNLDRVIGYYRGLQNALGMPLLVANKLEEPKKPWWKII